MLKKFIVIAIIIFLCFGIESWKRENGIKIWWWDIVFGYYGVPDENRTIYYKMTYAKDLKFDFMDIKDFDCLVKSRNEIRNVNCEEFFKVVSNIY